MENLTSEPEESVSCSVFKSKTIANWHTLPASRVARTWESDLDGGVTSSVARGRLQKLGRNVVGNSPLEPGFQLFFSQLKSLPASLLLISAGLAVLTGNTSDAVVILTVVGLNAYLGYATETRTKQMIRAIATPPKRLSTVVRDGEIQHVPIDALVPGNLLLLFPGSYVAADARVVEADRLSVDESSLTGESLPAHKHEKVIFLTSAPLAERANMVYRGTTVTGGSGKAIVVATGMHTEAGNIQRLLDSAGQRLTPLQQELDTLGRHLVFFTCLACGGVFAAGLLRRQLILSSLRIAVSLAVAAIPEGLPAIATSAFALAILKLRRRGVLVRHMNALEALGSVEVLCLDKTGTLTLNRMSVRSILTLSG